MHEILALDFKKIQPSIKHGIFVSNQTSATAVNLHEMYDR
jgi:hypothetical protein